MAWKRFISPDILVDAAHIQQRRHQGAADSFSDGPQFSSMHPIKLRIDVHQAPSKQ